jgi:hypothetical protein
MTTLYVLFFLLVVPDIATLRWRIDSFENMFLKS